MIPSLLDLVRKQTCHRATAILMTFVCVSRSYLEYKKAGLKIRGHWAEVKYGDEVRSHNHVQWAWRIGCLSCPHGNVMEERSKRD